MKSRPWGRKTLLRAPIAREAFRTHPVRVCTFVPAFTLPLHRLPLPPQSNRHPAAAVIHNGLSTEKLSTSLPAALCKTFSPSRLRTRIYNISFARRPLPGRVRAAPEKSPRRCDPVSRAAERRVGGRRQRRTPPRTATRTFPAYGPVLARLRSSPCPLMGRITVRKGRSVQGKPRPCPCVLPRDSLSTPSLLPPKWAPRLRRREGKRPNGAPPHRNAHTPNAERKRYLHNSRTKTQRRTKRCAQFVIFVFTPCKLLHNFSTVLHRSPRNVPERAQIAARRPDFPCFTARFPNVLPESHRAKHPRTAPVLPPKNAPLRAYAKPRPHSRVRGTRQHATTCASFTFSARYERGGGTRNANFCPAEGRKWGRFRSQMLKNGPQTKKSTFSFGRLVI